MTDGGDGGDEFGWFECDCVAFSPEDVLDGFVEGDIGEGEDGGAVGLSGDELWGGCEAFMDLSGEGGCVANYDVWDGIEGKERGIFEGTGGRGVIIEKVWCFAGALDTVDSEDADAVVAGGALFAAAIAFAAVYDVKRAAKRRKYEAASFSRRA